jgi:hypothetical protein
MLVFMEVPVVELHVGDRVRGAGKSVSRIKGMEIVRGCRNLHVRTDHTMCFDRAGFAVIVDESRST